MTVKVIFHSFTMGDVDDVDIYVAQPIWEWQQTDQGKWVMSNASDLKYYTHADPNTFGHRVTIRGELEEIKATEYYLRWK
jgi:hypothetical protein